MSTSHIAAVTQALLSARTDQLPVDPTPLLAALQPGGRLVAVVGEQPVMTAQLITRTSDSGYAAEALFDTLASPLKGFPQKERFVF